MGLFDYGVKVIPYFSTAGDKIYPSIVDIRKGVRTTETISFVTADANTTFISIQLVYDTENYSLSETDRVLCYIKRPDEQVLEIVCDRINTNTIEIPLGVNGTAIEGTYTFDIKIFREDGKIIATPLMNYTVNSSISVDDLYEGEERVPVLVELIKTVEDMKTSIEGVMPNVDKINETVPIMEQVIAEGRQVISDTTVAKDTMLEQVNTTLTNAVGTMQEATEEMKLEVGQAVSQIDIKISAKVDKGTVYLKEETMSKQEITEAISNVEVDLSGYATKAELNTKADTTHNHSYNDLQDLPVIPSLSGYATESFVNQKVATIIDSAPEALDTLYELAGALGNDPNFSTTVMAEIGSKADLMYVTDELNKKVDYYHLTSELSRKADNGHTHTKSNITDFSHTHTREELISVNASSVTGVLDKSNLPKLTSSDITRPNDSTIESSIASVEGELSKNENTKLSTLNGTKEFNCKDGYVDNIHIEGSTLVNYSNSELSTMGGGATNSDKVVTLPNGGYVSYLIGNSSTTGTKELSGKTLTVEYNAPIVIGEEQLRMCVVYIPTDSSNAVYLSTYAYVNKVTVTVPDVTYKRLAVYINNTKDEVITQEHKIVCVEGDYSTKSLSYFDGIKSAGQGNTIEVVTQNADETRQDKRQISTTLRGIPSGMKDEIIKQSDKYCKIHKCKEMTLSSTTGDWYMTGSELNNTLQFGVLLTDSFDRANVVCNRFIQSSNKAVGVGYEAISILNNSKAQPTLYVRIDKSKLSSPDVTGFKAWLDTNSIIVVYELLTPLVEELYNFNPRTFEGKTTLLLNSGVVQCDASFEVTNSLGSSLDVLFSIVSELQREVGSVKEGLIDTTNLLVDLL